jgi:hypothetical protein
MGSETVGHASWQCAAKEMMEAAGDPGHAGMWQDFLGFPKRHQRDTPYFQSPCRRGVSVPLFGSTLALGLSNGQNAVYLIARPAFKCLKIVFEPGFLVARAQQARVIFP